MKNEEMNVFERKLEGKALQAAMGLRDAKKQMDQGAAPIAKELAALQAKAQELQGLMDSLHSVFDELRVEFFKTLEKELGVSLDATSLDFRGEEVFVVRTQEDVDRAEFFRSLRENPIEALREALDSGDVTLGCGDPECASCSTKHQLGVTMKSEDPILLVRDFTEAFQLDWKEKPGVPTEQTALLRVQLAAEELSELVHALAAKDMVEVVDALTDIDYVTYGAMGAFGLYELPVGFVSPNVPEHPWGKLSAWEQLAVVHEIARHLNVCTMAFSMVLHPSMDAQVKGQDAAYFALRMVLKATANAWAALGVLKYREAAFLEVQRSNMSKLGPDGLPILNEAGRVSKGPNYQAPDLAKVISEVDSHVNS